MPLLSKEVQYTLDITSYNRDKQRDTRLVTWKLVEFLLVGVSSIMATTGANDFQHNDVT